MQRHGNHWFDWSGFEKERKLLTQERKHNVASFAGKHWLLVWTSIDFNRSTGLKTTRRVCQENLLLVCEDVQAAEPMPGWYSIQSPERFITSKLNEFVLFLCFFETPVVSRCWIQVAVLVTNESACWHAESPHVTDCSASSVNKPGTPVEISELRRVVQSFYKPHVRRRFLETQWKLADSLPVQKKEDWLFISSLYDITGSIE